MRLTEIKLSGFKSFVDATTIATPGQLVGVVGPNGCGKSNVIDAVRWVLGESKASALRGESMQDVIFNGAGERKPVGRAAVELRFDNSLGRIGGQWGQYAEISIKRLLTRDGDSTYYINNIPVRRRDIHDLFLGTGLGPRAYAIIEQGMISRVIEAKPEELRIFLEEAAGVSKYKERRKETEGRLADARENLSRVEDIRLELESQLSRLHQQAEVASQYQSLEMRLKQSQHMLWFAKQQDAARNRERCTGEIASLTIALEAIQAELRSAEAQLEALRAEHYAAGDALHERQGGFYEANAEVSRLEQQLSFTRESETRITQQVAQLNEALGALVGQEAALTSDESAANAALETALVLREQAASDEKVAHAALPELDRAVRSTTAEHDEWQRQIALTGQGVRVAETQRDNVVQLLGQLHTRRVRLEEELVAIAEPSTDPIQIVVEQLAQENADLADKQRTLATLQGTVEDLQQRQRSTGDLWERESQRLAELQARQDALTTLQARIGHGTDIDGWLVFNKLDRARRLWQVVDIERGWEDALEAVLRERLSAIELTHLDDVIAWVAEGAQPPRRIAAYEPAPDKANGPPTDHGDSLLAKVRRKHDDVGRVLADGLAGVRCCDDLRSALAQREALAIGEAMVTPDGHIVTARSVIFFAPDNELHGVLARQREIDELDVALITAAQAAANARVQRDAVDADLHLAQQTYHAEGLAVGSQQRRVHDLDIELMQLRQAAEAAHARRAQIISETEQVVAQANDSQQQVTTTGTQIADLQSRLHDELAKRDAALLQRDEAEAALAHGRERLRVAERAAQEAGFAERSARERLAELARRREGLAAQSAQHRALHEQLTVERAAIDWTPVEEALQRQLAARGTAEHALATARDRVEAFAAQLRSAEEARLVAEHKLDPARARILEAQLKEQAAALAEQQFTEQLADAHASIDVLPDALKAWGSARTLPAEIERLSVAIAELGPVNMAALDELTQASGRKDYLDAQAADLTEAMKTLETAIRQIDRESREMLQQTFDAVNANFARLFPTLFGGGEAKLLLTGEEILDSGVQVIAQPPGKRNTTIHLLSGGEKALTAISLVFALFQLNPAPFCLLDEVDAPLDDPNTERFCAMVQTMARETQFVFISHNKITMEMAHQLVGITMPEPGVSRVVAVDIAEALSLAESTV